MEKIISEIVIGALFLALLVSVIPLYRANQELVSEMAGQADYNEKIKEIIKPDIPDREWICGSDVIAAIRFYAFDPGVSVTVNGQSGSKTFFDTDYDESDYRVKREKNYYSFVYDINGKPRFIFVEGV